jgi:hypothetical protein
MPNSKTLSEADIDRLLAEVAEENFLTDTSEFFGLRHIVIDGFDDGEWVAPETMRAIQSLGVAL